MKAWIKIEFDTLLRKHQDKINERHTLALSIEQMDKDIKCMVDLLYWMNSKINIGELYKNDWRERAAEYLDNMRDEE